MLHDVRQCRVLRTGPAHGGVQNPRRPSAVDGHWCRRCDPITDGRTGRRDRQRRSKVSKEIRHDHW